ncbi:SpvB/TcaC N-terminal domain-containing protein [Sandaracinus amylolyticus]|uniref:Insecticidal toxin complex protein n=1 Tax=Sandaracinus amylolyticus TaxID=927083 RepID=A0A0F6SEH1_9BACT|nr:SpvB/TcaC N-terminal domain-containing protein [Sandaracinus amylolyticus]AKF05184.1 insecticidal toxin complex protein [Sandaracinus amylolyticus]
MSDDRVSLPDGPGSIDGIGDNVEVDPNMGSMSYSVDIELPAGHPGMAPALGLRYGSAAGVSTVGIGWSLSVPSIERNTLRGLPRYVADDEFVANGGEQLVRVSSSGGSAVYRARFEREFVRYTWRNVGSGAAGYWTAEWPDGRIGYFGATATGTLVPSARLEQSGRAYRYMLVEVVDRFDHHTRYSYDASSGTPLLTRVAWAYQGSTPSYEVELAYEDRPDPMSDASPGWEEITSQRLRYVSVRSHGEVIRGYRLTYEPEATSGGLSRLAQVERIGRDGSVYPVVHSFEYSRSLGAMCGAARCDQPYLVEMGTIDAAGGIRSGQATLVDINGDALPDLVDSSLSRHRFYLNELGTDGAARFGSAPVMSATQSSGFQFHVPSVQILDVNGDGFADLTNASTRQMLCNRATGDWSACGASETMGSVDFSFQDDTSDGASDNTPLHTRFIDLNGDRRIDVLRTQSATTAVAWLNTPSGFVDFDRVEAPGVVFDQGDPSHLADMNGDGLLDVVEVRRIGLRWRLNLGWGHWADWQDVTGVSFASDSEVLDAQLEDLNGDGRDDVVLVQGNTVRYALNRNLGEMSAFMEMRSSSAVPIPTRTNETTVLFADMNGSGSRDVVWVESSGQVRYLELFPVRPNLMSRLENGIGMVHAIEYGTSVAQQAAQREAGDREWAHPLPHPMAVVDETDTWVTLTGGDDGSGLHEVVSYVYRDGFYDGVEKTFRGYAEVETRVHADMSRDSQEPALTVQEFDVGAEDPYRAGLTLRTAIFSGEETRPLREERHVYGDCEVAGVPTSGLRFPVRHVCETEVSTIHQEGAAPEEWATVRTETQYDGYGHPTLRIEHGVVHMGPPEMSSACAPCDLALSADQYGGACGAECLGDERYDESAYVEPGRNTDDHWILGMAHTHRVYAVPGGAASEEHTYYDGPDFEGLPLGRLTAGRVTRKTQRVSETEEIQTERNALDAHGNVIATLDPLGDPDDMTGHRREYVMDADGLRVVRTDVLLSTPEGRPYRLRREYGYEPAFDLVVESSAWMIEGLGEALSARNATHYGYDEFGRLRALARPGDTLDAPSMEVSWELGSPVSRIVIRRRSAPGAAADIQRVRCVDGRGQIVQELTQLESGDWLASGFVEHNRAGARVRIHQPHRAPSGDCAARPPSDVRHVDLQYDGAQREIRRVMPDADEHGGVASEIHVEHGPLWQRTYDENDTDEESAHAGTPDVVRSDGLGRTVVLERVLRTDAGDTRSTTRLFYDGRGHLAGYVDALGSTKQQARDLAGRVVRIEDPSTGVVLLEHDAAGNVVARTDARGITTRSEFDGANRPVARYREDSPSDSHIAFRYDFAPDCDRRACAHAEGQLVETAYPLPDEIAAALATERAGLDRYGYDARGRLVRQQRRLGSAMLELVETFDGADRVVATRHPDGREVRRTYDGGDRIVAIEGVIDRVEHDERGMPRRVVRADGAEDVVSYDALMREVSRASLARSGEPLQDYVVRRDRHGQVEEIVERGGMRPESRRYRHDSLDRLVAATITRDPDIEEGLSFGHDLLDNVTSTTSSLGEVSRAHVGEYVHDPARPSIATELGTLAQSHDEAGHLIARGHVELEWDFLGRLVRATERGRARGVFAYGADQQRVAKLEDGSLTIYLGRDFEVRDGVARAYARLGRDRVSRAQSTTLGPVLYRDHDGDESISAADALRSYEDDRPSRVALLHASARRVLHEAAPAPVQLFHDDVGSVVGATRDGEIVGLRRLYPFGETQTERGFVDERSFTGQERDSSTGLLCFEWRYLDPYSARWISADPAFEELGEDRPLEATARYGYVGANPLVSTDPTGLMEGNETTQGATSTSTQQPSSDGPRGIGGHIANYLGNKAATVLGLVSGWNAMTTVHNGIDMLTSSTGARETTGGGVQIALGGAMGILWAVTGARGEQGDSVGTMVLNSASDMTRDMVLYATGNLVSSGLTHAFSTDPEDHFQHDAYNYTILGVGVVGQMVIKAIRAPQTLRSLAGYVTRGSSSETGGTHEAYDVP